MITELQARRMSNEQVLEVLKRSCERHNQKLIHAQYNSASLELAVLVDEIRDFGSVEADMDSVLIGLRDFNFRPVEDDRPHLSNEPCCPATIVICNKDNYIDLAKVTGGVQVI